MSATNASNVSITGGGVIDGAGESWWKEARAQGDHGIMGQGMLRPRLIVFDHSHKILIDGVTVQNSPFWQIVRLLLRRCYDSQYQGAGGSRFSEHGCD